MNVLVTRGWPGAERTATGLRAMGINPIISPVLDVNFRAALNVNLDYVQAIVFTSSNGVRSWGPRRQERDFPVFTVGEATAAAARDIGFTDVYAARGDVESLAELIIDDLSPSTGAILHVRGIHVAGDLSGALKAAGFTCRESIGYGTVSVDSLGEDAIASILSGSPVKVLIHSARGAKAFLELLKKFGLNRWLGSVSVYGISKKAVKPLEGVGFADIQTAPTPDENALLGLLKNAEELVPAHDAS